ncbi:TBP-associated factor 9 isoform X1 [Lycorma delicatula]|uniref:TBP-associated factor 9 isoform X1 n=1 Tax=Lycorma delicatula TaxID=130591 RepID=UPI003F51AA00
MGSVFNAKMASQNKVSLSSQKVIQSMLKEIGINDYEPRVVNQLLEFTYRYVTCILDDARVYASHAKKKGIDVEDVKLAVQMQLDRVFTTPPPRDILLEIARTKNNTPLPLVKPHCGVRLPPDRYCLNSCNYRMRSHNSNNKKMKQFGHQSQGVTGTFMSSGQSGVKIAAKTASLSLVKRPGSITTIPRTQSITAPKQVIKFSAAGMAQKIQVKPKIQISSSSPAPQVEVMGQNVKIEVDDSNNPLSSNPLKRKREDDGQFDEYDSNT